MNCNHKTFLNHVVLDGPFANGAPAQPRRSLDGRMIWRCTHCGKTGSWGYWWSYFGTIECPRCQVAAMEWVACSRECAKALSGGKTPIQAERDTKPRKATGPRARRMTLRDKAKEYDRLVAEGKVTP